MNGAGEKPSSLWKRLRDAAGAIDTPAPQTTPPAPTPSAPATPPPDAPEPVATPEPAIAKDLRIDTDELTMRDARLVAQNAASEAQRAGIAIEELNNKVKALQLSKGGKKEWKDLINKIKGEQKNIDLLEDNLNDAHANLPKLNAPDVQTLAAAVFDVGKKVPTFKGELDKILKEAALERDNAPFDTTLTKALTAAQSAQPATSLSTALNTRPKGSAHLPSSTLGTALHHAAEQTKDTGKVGVELGREIEAMQTKIDSRFVKIFSVMDQAVGRIVDNKAYAPGPDGESVVPLNNYDSKEFKNPLEAYKAQLMATMEAANGFADIVKVLPQEVMDLTVELRDTERNFLAKLKRESNPPPTVPPTVPPFDPAAAPTSVATSAITLSQIDVGKEPPLDAGKREAGRALRGALTTLGAIENLKTHIDAQIINILNTINEVMSRATNGEAYTDAGGEISAVTDDPNPVNRLETTVRVASDLIDILARLPKEVTTLVSEIHDAEQQIVDAFDAYQAKPSQ